MSKSNESPLSTRQGEGLAEGQLRYREVTVGRKPMAKHWPDEQESLMRRLRWMRRPRYPKSHTCTESVGVYAAGIRVKAGAHYPGRPSVLPLATGVTKYREGTGEVIRGRRSRNRSAVNSNILLDDLDKELEKRGHCFCGYADDCNIEVATRRPG